MSDDAPKIVLMGKHSGRVDISETRELLADIEPEGVPTKFMEALYLTCVSGQELSIVKEDLPEDLDQSLLESQVRALVGNDPIAVISIVVDLDLLHETINNQCDDLFSGIIK